AHNAQPAVVAGPEHVSINAVGEQADDAIASSRLRRQLLGREWDVVVGCDDLVTCISQRVGPARGQASGDEYTSHLVGGVVDLAGTLDADGKAEAMDRRVVTHRPQ